MSEAETTHDSLNLEQLEANQGYGTYGGGTAGRGGVGQPPPIYETETLSKRDYYTARRNTKDDLASGGNLPNAAEEPVKGNMARCEVVMLDGTSERFDIDVS